MGKKKKFHIYIFIHFIMNIAFAMEELERNSNNTKSPTVLLPMDLRETWSYTGLKIGSLVLSKFSTQTILQPTNVIDIFFASQTLPACIDKIIANESKVNHLLKGVVQCATWSTVVYNIYYNPYECLTSLGTALGIRYIAEKTLKSLMPKPSTLYHKEVMGGGLALTEQILNAIIRNDLSFSFDPLHLPNAEAAASFHNANNFNQMNNETCPIYNPYSPSSLPISAQICESFSCQQSLVPQKYCLLFEKSVHEFSIDVWKKSFNKLNFSNFYNQEKFGIVVGENHNSASNFLAEIFLLKTAKSMGVENFFVEYNAPELEVMLRNTVCNPDQKYYINCQKIVAAKNLNMTIIPIDSILKKLNNSSFCSTLESIFNTAREKEMCRHIGNMKESFITFLGDSHLSHLLYNCQKTKNSSHLIYIMLSNRENTFEKFNKKYSKLQKCSQYIMNRENQVRTALDDTRVQFFNFTITDDMSIPSYFSDLMSLINEKLIKDYEIPFVDS